MCDCTEAAAEFISSAESTATVQDLSRCQKSQDTTSEDHLTHTLIYTQSHCLEMVDRSACCVYVEVVYIAMYTDS